jgi:hypothetical protein
MSARAGRSVRVIADPDVIWERAEPVELEVPFGTEELAFTLAPEEDSPIYELRVVDAATGAPVTSGVRASVCGPWQRARLGREEPLSDFGGGEWRVTLPPRAGLRWRVVAAGYRLVEGSFPPPRAGEPFTALDPEQAHPQPGAPGLPRCAEPAAQGARGLVAPSAALLSTGLSLPHRFSFLVAWPGRSGAPIPFRRQQSAGRSSRSAKRRKTRCIGFQASNRTRI